MSIINVLYFYEGRISRIIYAHRRHNDDEQKGHFSAKYMKLAKIYHEISTLSMDLLTWKIILGGDASFILWEDGFDFFAY